MLEREQVEKTICKRKREVAWRLVGKKEGSEQTSVMHNIHGDMAVASEAQEKWPEQSWLLEIGHIHKPTGITDGLPQLS